MSPLALFDLDNTLVDRSAAFRRWADGFVIRNNLEVGAVDWLCEADNDGFARRPAFFSRVLDQFELEDQVDELVAAYWAEYLAAYKPDPKVVEALDRLRTSGWVIGIVTNGPSTQHEKIARAELLDVVDACCVSDEIGAQKPDIRIFEEAFKRCGVSSGWMVGDAPEPDIGGGHNAGLRTIWIHRGRKWEIPEYRPDAEVSSVPEAVELLLALA